MELRPSSAQWGPHSKGGKPNRLDVEDLRPTVKPSPDTDANGIMSGDDTRIPAIIITY